MKLIVDTREQLPYLEVFDHEKIDYERRSLAVGDYSIEGFPEFVLERKELNDFVKSITYDRERFERELKKAEDLGFFAVLIEASLYDIINRKYHSKTHPNVVLSTMFQWTVKYGIPFLLVENRTGGALAVIEMSKAYLKTRCNTIA